MRPWPPLDSKPDPLIYIYGCLDVIYEHKSVAYFRTVGQSHGLLGSRAGEEEEGEKEKRRRRRRRSRIRRIRIPI